LEATSGRSFIGDVSFQGMERRLHALQERVTLFPVPFVTYLPRSYLRIFVDSFCDAVGFCVLDWRELGDCCSDVTRSQRFEKESISKVSEAAIGVL
jgi:hypothetical protein